MKYCLKYLILLQVSFGFGQNIVPNASFEELECPEEIILHTISYCKSWFDTPDTRTADLFHACFEDDFFTPPYNVSGTSYPNSGIGMGGFIPMMVSSSSDSREILSVKLIEPLIADSAYCVRFYVKNSKYFNYEYGIDNIGILFTEDTIKLFQVLELQPHVRNKVGAILSENDWHLIEGYYVANGKENYLNIGTFGERQSINWFFDGPNYLPNSLPAHLYYFVDDVSVSNCDKDSLLNVELNAPNIFTPNGDLINDKFELKLKNIDELTVKIVNRWGNVVVNYDGLQFSWDGTDRGLPATDGVYFYVISGFDNFGNKIERTGHVTIVR